MTSNVNDVGTTAFIIAHIRAMEEHRSRPLFRDPYAAWFERPETADATKAAQRFLDAHPAAGPAIRYRTRFFDQFVTQGISAGARQIVSLGAGLTMRAHILAAAGVDFYDVDQPGVLGFKHSVLRERGLAPAPSLACNYLETDLPARLREIGLDPSLPTLILWEGNTVYLPPESIFPLLNHVAAGIPSLRLAFDYFTVDPSRRDLEDEQRAGLLDRLEAALGAPLVTGFPDLSVFERETPFRVVDSGEVLALHREYEPDAEVEGLDEIADVYAWCILEARAAAAPVTAREAAPGTKPADEPRSEPA